MKKKKLSKKASKAAEDDEFDWDCKHCIYNDRHGLFVCLLDGEIWPEDSLYVPCSKDCNGYTPDS